MFNFPLQTIQRSDICHGSSPPQLLLRVVERAALDFSSVDALALLLDGVIVGAVYLKDTVKPGDKVTVSMRPLRSGSHGGGSEGVVGPDIDRIVTKACG